MRWIGIIRCLPSNARTLCSMWYVRKDVCHRVFGRRANVVAYETVTLAA